MLILQQYGVKLVRLQEEDIELVRHWRNQSDIANFMEYRNYITVEAQSKWFNSVNNKYNYYFIIEFENKKVGLINAKNFDPAIGFGEGGIFIWDKDYINSFAAVFGTLCLLNFVFLELKLCKISRIRILKNNDRAIHYNQLIGYKLLPDQESTENQLYELTYDDYIANCTKLNKVAAMLNDSGSQIKVSGEESELNLTELNTYLKLKRG